jgi:integral membrane sensor domain MASE1
MLPRGRAIGLAIVVGVAYFLAAQLTFALLARSDGLTMFWLAGGVSSGVLIVFGRGAQLPVASAMLVAVIIASLMGHRTIWVSTAFALCNVGETIFAAWLIERYFGSPFTHDSLRNVLGLLAVAVVAMAPRQPARRWLTAYSSAQRHRFGSPGSIGFYPAPSESSPLRR